jgi:hypothetical protein
MWLKGSIATSHIGRKSIYLESIKSIMVFKKNSCKGPIKVAHCKKRKKNFEMHSQLINMDCK